MSVPATGTPDIQPREAWLTGIGLAFIVVIAVFVVVWYGTGGEASATGILGATIPAIAAIVSAVIGVAMGAKTGAAAGTQAAQQMKRTAASAIRQAKASVDAAAAAKRTARIDSAGSELPGPPSTDEVQRKLENASTRLDAILDTLEK